MRAHRYQYLSRGRIATRGEMNATERRYAELLEADPQVVRWWFEPFSLRLSQPEKGQPARYTPDFLVLMADGSTYLDDVKGSGPVDPASLVRVKCAAELYPLWIFRTATERLKRDGGGFKLMEV